MLMLSILNVIKKVIYFLSDAFELYYMDEGTKDSYKYANGTYKYKRYI